MMRSPRLRHSWPVLSKPEGSQPQNDLNDDPFRFFVSDPVESEDVIVPRSTTPGAGLVRARSHSPSYQKALASLEDTSNTVAKLKTWIEKMEVRLFHRNSPAIHQQAISQKSIEPPKTPEQVPTPFRGRNDVRMGSSQRTLSRNRPRRPRTRSWQAPSEDIWPVAEEREESASDDTP